jgi:hypothetical protein
MSGTICFLLRDEPPRDLWRFAVTSRPVTDFVRVESKRLGIKVYSVATIYGDEQTARQLEGYLQNYSREDGWFGPLAEDVMRGIAIRIRRETATFLDGEPLQ